VRQNCRAPATTPAWRDLDANDGRASRITAGRVDSLAVERLVGGRRAAAIGAIIVLSAIGLLLQHAREELRPGTYSQFEDMSIRTHHSARATAPATAPMSPSTNDLKIAPTGSMAGGTTGGTTGNPVGALAGWFAARGWNAHRFQLDAWAAWRRGESGLIHVPTGSGKTYAATLAALGEIVDLTVAGTLSSDGPALIYVTPLRAVSRDIAKALAAPLEATGLDIEVGSRTGDTEANERARQRRRMPPVLITTPESLTLLLTADDAPRTFAPLRTVVVDEWHELLGSKRGVQMELALARLRRHAPRLRTWALSATLADPIAAAQTVVGRQPTGSAPATVIRAEIDRPVVVSSIMPDSVERFPWAGHMGLVMLEPLLRVLDPTIPTLIFTNTRSQAERWFQELLAARPEWAERLALHHGSIDRPIRERIEAGLKAGTTTLVVCTSSLDLGVDFAPVERVVQIGSPKGVARLMQRAGRSAHRPGAACEVICVPAHALELVEIAAAREAIERREVEARPTLRRPLDVLVQHLVSMSFGKGPNGGFDSDQLFDEVTTTATYHDLAREEFDWCVALVEHGGKTLNAYPQHHRVVRRDGRFVIAGRRHAAIHRLNIGTITGDATVTLRLVGRGAKTLGSIEEHFVGKLRPGDVFIFGGRMLEFVRLRDLVATAKPATKRSTYTPHWNGSRFPLSTALSAAMRRTLSELATIETPSPPASLAPELRKAWPVIETQRRLSVVPSADETLVELCASEDGQHCFLYPIEGRLVHEGLVALLALRLGRRHPATFAMSINDYGIELLSSTPHPFREAFAPDSIESLFATATLLDDLLEAISLGELSRRQFREVARIAGLVPQRHPGRGGVAERATRQLQAGASLLYEVFEQFDPTNLLLVQCRREVLERHCEESRLARTMTRIATQRIRVVEVERPTPMALPLVADRLGATLSTESVRARIARMID